MDKIYKGFAAISLSSYNIAAFNLNEEIALKALQKEIETEFNESKNKKGKV